MYIATIPNRSSPPAILLRESFREHGQVKNRTLANLSGWSRDRVEALREVLRGRGGAPAAPRATTALEIVRSWPHGHVAAGVGKGRGVWGPRGYGGRPPRGAAPRWGE